MDLTRSRGSKGDALPDEPNVLIVGIGNSFRADDAVGPIVAAEIARRALPFLKVVEDAGDTLSLLALWEGIHTAIVVDAVVSGAAAGTIHRLDLVRDPLPGWLSRTSTHLVGFAEALELARVINRLPPRLIFYGVEGRGFEMGGELSDAVQKAVPAVVEQMLADVRQELGAMGPAFALGRGDK